MRRVLFRYRNLTVWSYPAMLYFGLVFGVVAGNLAAHRAGIDPVRTYIATIILIVPALAGARLLYVAAHWQMYRRDPRRIWNRREGGYIMYGGFPIALLLSVPLLAALHLPFGAFWDVASFTILIGMMFARIGCLLNGCCAGRPSSAWCTLSLPNAAGLWRKRIPTQIFEAAIAALLLLFAMAVWHSMPFSGALFLFVTLGYSGARFAMEFAREQEPTGSVFGIAQVISVVAFLSSLSTLTVFWRH